MLFFRKADRISGRKSVKSESIIEQKCLDSNSKLANCRQRGRQLYLSVLETDPKRFAESSEELDIWGDSSIAEISKTNEQDWGYLSSRDIQQNLQIQIGDIDAKNKHILNECSNLTQKEYKRRHDWAGRIFFEKGANDCNLTIRTNSISTNQNLS